MTISSHQLELLSRQINQAHRSAVDAELAARGLREIGHPMLLSILQSSSGTDKEGACHAQRELAELLHISPAAVANSLKSLEKSGYIRRQPGQDARKNQVILTVKGRQAVEGCQAVFETIACQMLRGFSPEESEQFLSFQRRILSNLRSGCSATTQAKEEP